MCNANMRCVHMYLPRFGFTQFVLCAQLGQGTSCARFRKVVCLVAMAIIWNHGVAARRQCCRQT
nr:hypothetical protein Iba_chr14bCG7450 [Ipomoea batatas]